MIRSVRGRLAARDEDAAVVEVGGVGLLVRVSTTTALSLPAIGEPVELTTHLAVRDDALDLYGFFGDDERRLFEAFLGVSGVGPRMALALCGVDSPDVMRRAIARGDSATVQRAHGVGKRIAERVVLELRERIGAVAPSPGGDAEAEADADAFIAARDGLVGLGFRPEDADAALADAPEEADAEALIRHGLGRLRK